MNKILFRLIGVIAVAIYSIPTSAQTFEVDGIYYEVDPTNSEIAIVTKRPSGYYQEASYSIPANVIYGNRTLHVGKIGESAFFLCSKVSSITLPNTLTEIDKSAFRGCSKLPSISLPATLTKIGDEAFSGCELLKTLVIPQKVEKIGKEVIYGCDALESLQVESGNAVYNSDGNCNSIIETSTKTLIAGCKNSVIPESVEYIGTYAFSNNNGLLSLSIPNSVKGIGDNAFFLCSNLEMVTMSESLTEIGRSAFDGCSKLPSISLPATLTKIGDEAFSGCELLKTLVIPQKVEKIGKEVIYGCDALESLQVESGNAVYNSDGNCNSIIETSTKTLIAGCKNSVIPESVEYIGTYAFSNNNGLLSLSIPNSVKGIGDNAFFLCSNLEMVTMSESLTEIGRSAFDGCSKLPSISLPATLTKIGDEAFSGCVKLFEIISNIENPFSIDESVFYDYKNTIYTNAVLSVPEGKVETYRNAAGWKKFANIQVIEPDPTPVIDDKTYVIHKRAGQADLQSVVSGEYIVVPETIEYDGKSYSVTRILDSAFMGGNMIFLSIPNSIKYIGVDVIKDCYRLAAVDWNPTFKPSDEFVSNIVNPNLLFYITEEQYKPNGVRNVVVGEQANSITLTDEINGNFYCPKAFTTSSITYTHNYGLPTEKGLAQGWESIVLPFDVATIKTANGDVIKPVSIAGAGEKRFWLRELTETGFAEVGSLKANTPYIISMPNWEGYQDFYNITGDVFFSAQNVTVQPSDNLQNSTSGSYQFSPNYQVKEQDGDYYTLNLTELIDNGTTYAPGSVFKQGLRVVRPFEAYLIASGSAAARRCISIADLINGTTAIADIPVSGESIYSNNGVIYIESAAADNCIIYSMSGQLVRTLALKAGTNIVGGLTKGVYIVNGQKLLVK